MASNIASISMRLALVLSLIGLWFMMTPGQGYACSCVDPGSPSEALADSAAVFSGRVVSIDRSRVKQSSADPLIVEFEVMTVWKGPADRRMHVTTPVNSASCGYSFLEGAEYLVYSWNGSEVYMCSRTRGLSGASFDIAELGEGQTLSEGATAPTPVVSGPSASGGCGPSSHADGLPLAGLMAGIAWLGLLKRRPGAR